MNNIITINSSFGEQIAIVNEAKQKRINFKIIDMIDHDRIFIENSSSNPIRVDGKVFKFIFMTAVKQTQFHNHMVIVCSNDKKDIENWKN